MTIQQHLKAARAAALSHLSERIGVFDPLGNAITKAAPNIQRKPFVRLTRNNQTYAELFDFPRIEAGDSIEIECYFDGAENRQTILDDEAHGAYVRIVNGHLEINPDYWQLEHANLNERKISIIRLRAVQDVELSHLGRLAKTSRPEFQFNGVNQYGVFTNPVNAPSGIAMEFTLGTTSTNVFIFSGSRSGAILSDGTCTFDCIIDGTYFAKGQSILHLLDGKARNWQVSSSTPFELTHIMAFKTGVQAVAGVFYDLKVNGVDWPLDRHGEAIQPSIPAGNNLTIVNHNPQDWTSPDTQDHQAFNGYLPALRLFKRDELRCEIGINTTEPGLRDSVSGRIVASLHNLGDSYQEMFAYSPAHQAWLAQELWHRPPLENLFVEGAWRRVDEMPNQPIEPENEYLIELKFNEIHGGVRMVVGRQGSPTAVYSGHQQSTVYALTNSDLYLQNTWAGSSIGYIASSVKKCVRDNTQPYEPPQEPLMLNAIVRQQPTQPGDAFGHTQTPHIVKFDPNEWPQHQSGHVIQCQLGEFYLQQIIEQTPERVTYTLRKK